MKFLGDKNLTLKDILDISLNFEKVSLTESSKKRMYSSHNFLKEKLKQGEKLYGVNTGFGALSSIKISDKDILDLQKNLIRSHSVGVGSCFSKSQCRAIMLLRVHALAYGHSGIRYEVVEKLIEFLNKDIHPVIYTQGSVGASGDLAPLAHLALNLIGEGELWGEKGEKTEALKILKNKNIEPLKLEVKEGLSLINGCQVMTAVGLLSLGELQILSKWMDTIGAMSLEALKGSRTAFDPLISNVRNHLGDLVTAKNLRYLLGEKSPIGESHKDCERVQDAYSLRCIPAVHGGFKVALRRSIETLEIEVNSSTDNPLVFSEEKKILSCGNFHGQPVAFVLDYMALALAGTSSMSERRVEKLTNSSESLLPSFLACQSGLHSGYMMSHVTAAALVSENKILSHPASVDSIPTSAGKEDHVSMGTISARKLSKMLENVKNILAIEYLCASQALDFLKPLEPSEKVKKAYQYLRKKVSFSKGDRAFYKDIQITKKLLESKEVPDFFEELES